MISLDAGLQQEPIRENGESLYIPRYVPTAPPQGDSGAVAEAARLLATFRRKNRIFGSTQAHSKAEKPHRNARWGGFEVVN
jgi:hypothetical protein